MKREIILKVVGIILIVGALVYLGNIFLEYERGAAEYEKLEAILFEEPEDSLEAPAEDDAANAPGVSEGQDEQSDADEEKKESEEYKAPSPERVMAALKELKAMNDDVAGWISFDNLEISYPVMHCGDNEYYLRRTFSGENNSVGSIYIEGANSPDFEDYHTIVYGHNMRNLSMFGRLKYYVEEDFYKDHQYFTIYTEEHAYRYQIFAFYEIEETGDIYTIGFGPNEEYRKFVDNMKARAYYDTGVGVTEQDKVVTLSTCSSEGKRFVVNAKRVEVK